MPRLKVALIPAFFAWPLFLSIRPDIFSANVPWDRQ